MTWMRINGELPVHCLMQTTFESYLSQAINTLSLSQAMLTRQDGTRQFAWLCWMLFSSEITPSKEKRASKTAWLCVCFYAGKEVKRSLWDSSRFAFVVTREDTLPSFPLSSSLEPSHNNNAWWGIYGIRTSISASLGWVQKIPICISFKMEV